jgi:predicted membrane protein
MTTKKIKAICFVIAGLLIIVPLTIGFVFAFWDVLLIFMGEGFLLLIVAVDMGSSIKRPAIMFLLANFLFWVFFFISPANIL